MIEAYHSLQAKIPWNQKLKSCNYGKPQSHEGQSDSEFMRICFWKAALSDNTLTSITAQTLKTSSSHYGGFHRLN